MRRRKGTYKEEHHKLPGMEDRSRKQLWKGERRWRMHPPPPLTQASVLDTEAPPQWGREAYIGYQADKRSPGTTEG